MLDKPPLLIEVATPDATTLRLAISGDLDYASAGELSAVTVAAGCRRLDVDLSMVDFVDSSGLAALIGLHQRAAGGGAVLHVVALTPYVRHLLEMTGVARIFSLPPD